MVCVSVELGAYSVCESADESERDECSDCVVKVVVADVYGVMLSEDASG